MKDTQQPGPPAAKGPAVSSVSNSEWLLTCVVSSSLLRLPGLLQLPTREV